MIRNLCAMIVLGMLAAPGRADARDMNIRVFAINDYLTAFYDGRPAQAPHPASVGNWADSRKLLDFCGLEWQDSCVEFHRNPSPTTTASAAQVRRRLYGSSVSQWRHYAAELAELSGLLSAAGMSTDQLQ